MQPIQTTERHLTIDGRRIDVIDGITASVLRTKTPAERLEMTFDAWRFARSLTETGVRDQHPEWDADRVRTETARRMLGGPG